MKDSIKEILTGNHLNKMFKMYLVARKILKVKAYIKGTLTSEIKSPKLTHFWSFVGGGADLWEVKNVFQHPNNY